MFFSLSQKAIEDRDEDLVRELFAEIETRKFEDQMPNDIKAIQDFLYSEELEAIRKRIEVRFCFQFTSQILSRKFV